MIATKFQRLYPCFRGQATRIDYWEYCTVCGHVVNQRWRPLTGSRLEITFISARMHDSNEIPTTAQTWNCIPSSLSVLPDPRNMSVAVGISLLSCIRAEVYVISYLLPVNGRHLWFTTNPNTEQHFYFLLRLLWHWKRVIAVEIVLLSCIFAEIRVITLFQPPSLISDLRFHLGVLLIAPLKILPRKHRSCRWNFVPS